MLKPDVAFSVVGAVAPFCFQAVCLTRRVIRDRLLGSCPSSHLISRWVGREGSSSAKVPRRRDGGHGGDPHGGGFWDAVPAQVMIDWAINMGKRVSEIRALDISTIDKARKTQGLLFQVNGLILITMSQVIHSTFIRLDGHQRGCV